MEYYLEKVTQKNKQKLFNLLQFALYDGSQYIDNELNSDCLFDYKYFDNYFSDSTRESYFIKNEDKYLGFVMINENLKCIDNGKSIAEFLILPRYHREHIGKRVALEIFEKYNCNWEVEPIENSEVAYSFWENTINEYTNGNYKLTSEKVFTFKKE